MIQCSFCIGIGMIQCSFCIGIGMIQCSFCIGIGMIQCSFCIGIGMIQCSFCTGTEQLMLSSYQLALTVTINRKFQTNCQSQYILMIWYLMDAHVCVCLQQA